MTVKYLVLHADYSGHACAVTTRGSSAHACAVIFDRASYTHARYSQRTDSRLVTQLRKHYEAVKSRNRTGGVKRHTTDPGVNSVSTQREDERVRPQHQLRRPLQVLPDFPLHSAAPEECVR
ncbi:hypothetical protein AMELA_G00005460 [Ameiurus melas]|uniref:Uncharacterized protein n=1 Tax=Ameiurus melas TaxID=219545 RepID=A0A7J6BF54_AMEME|nr:hypothetical protein AMELA_G00005460 [Ameiurus melas]